MNFVDRTNHNQLAEQARQRASIVADKYIPAVEIGPTHNQPPEPIVVTAPAALLVNGEEFPAVTAASSDDAVKAYADAVMVNQPAIAAANDQMPLLKAFIADNPVIQTAEEAQKAAAWIEGTRKTLAAMEDERKPKVDPLNAALGGINEAYRTVRQPLEAMLNVLRKRWNTWDAAERERREAEARRAQEAADEAARQAQVLIDQANDAIAAADVGACEDVGTAVIDAQSAIATANKLDRIAGRAERATNVRVASTLGGKALASRRQRVIVIDDPCAAIKAIGLTDKIREAIQQSAKAFEEATGELPAGTHEDFTRSI